MKRTNLSFTQSLVNFKHKYADISDPRIDTKNFGTITFEIPDEKQIQQKNMITVC